MSLMALVSQSGEEQDDGPRAEKAMPEEEQHVHASYDASQQSQSHRDTVMMESCMKEEPSFSNLAMTLPDPNAGRDFTLSA